MSEELKDLIVQLAEDMKQLPEELRQPMLQEYLKHAKGARMAMEIMAEQKGA